MERGYGARSSSRQRDDDWNDERERWRSESRGERGDGEQRWSDVGDYPSEPSWGGRSPSYGAPYSTPYSSPYSSEDRWRESRSRGERLRRDDARDFQRGWQGGGMSQPQRGWRDERGYGGDGGSHTWELSRGFIRDPRRDPDTSWGWRPWEGVGSPMEGGSTYGSGSYGYRGSSYGYGGSMGTGSQTRGSSGGVHTGRGPKGYQRSDERIREDVCERLMQSGDVDASDVEVAVSRGEVTLTGTVESRQAKRDAEECCENVAGVVDVDNRIKVKGRSDLESSDSTSRSGAGSTSSGSSKTESKGAMASGTQSSSNAGRTSLGGS